MHIASVEGGKVLLWHEGTTIATSLDDWHHPALPDGSEDPLLLVSAPLEAQGKVHVVTVSALGDALAQLLHLEHAKPHRKGTALREAVEAAGVEWRAENGQSLHLDRGEPPELPPEPLPEPPPADVLFPPRGKPPGRSVE